MPWVRGERFDAIRPFAVSATIYPEASLALRTKEYKYVHNLPALGEEPLPHEELYDLRADPGELHNLADRNPELLEGFRSLAEPFRESWFAEVEAGIGALDKDTLSKLRALGYIK